jgi:beta-glucanase (GH16 family)
MGGTGGQLTGGSGGKPTGGSGGTPAGGTGGIATGGMGGKTGGTGGTSTGGTGTGGTPTGGTGTGGTPTGGTGTGGTPTGGASGNVILFDDFNGTSIDTSKWTVVERISDQANHELNCCLAANVSVSGGFLVGVSKFEDHTCGDSELAPTLQHYTSWHIQQKTPSFLYGTVEVRAKEPGGTGIWPTIWMLGYKWQASQPFTANIPGHNWPHDGWCEIDIAEFLQSTRDRVNNVVHFNVPGGTQEASLPFNATTRFMVYRLQWSAGSLIWSVNAEDGAGFRTLRTVTGAGNVPDVPMYLVINAAIGGLGGGTPNPSTFPQTFTVDWVRISQ